MNRRDAVLALLALGAPPIAAETQPAGRVWRIGTLYVLTSAQGARFSAEFRRGMQELGYSEGKHFVLEERYAENKNERLGVLAADLVRSKVDVLFAPTTNAASAAQKATASIPIVFVAVSDPVASGFAESVGRPGRNMTGLSNFAAELAPKRLELLRLAIPQLSKVAVLLNSSNPLYVGIEKRLSPAAASLGLNLVPVNAGTLEAIDLAFASMKREGASAVLIGGDVFHFQGRQRIVDAANVQGIASIAPFREYAEAGGMMTYGTDVTAQFRRAATYVDKIFKGARAGDLPIEQPAVFEFVVNLKTAKTLGITIPQALLVRADEVIR